MPQEFRRAVPRQTADWMAQYRFDDVAEESWRGCRVIDLSPLGAGLELFDIRPDEYMNGRLSVSVELHGETRNTLFDLENRTARVGVQFASITEAAKAYVDSLSDIRSRW